MTTDNLATNEASIQTASELDNLHTTGQLRLHANGDANSYAIFDDNQDWLLSVLHNGRHLTIVQEANLRRLVACWNACDGIPTADLLTGKKPVLTAAPAQHSKVQPEILADAREKFEAWMSDNGLWPRAVEKSASGNYLLMATHTNWQAWCAARGLSLK